jgi:hypothetical protein
MVAECRRQIESGKGFAVDVAHVGDDEHLGKPERQVDLGAGFERLCGGVVKISEVGDVELKRAGNLLQARWATGQCCC